MKMYQKFLNNENVSEILNNENVFEGCKTLFQSSDSLRAEFFKFKNVIFPE